MKRFKFYPQLDEMDCGPACLRMITRHHKKNIPLYEIRRLCNQSAMGVNLKSLMDAGEKLGYNILPVKLPFYSKDGPSLVSAPEPFIAHWNQKHFVVVYKVTKDKVWVADPAYGKTVMPVKEFKAGWETDGKGVILLFEQSGNYDENLELRTDKSFVEILSYLKPYTSVVLRVLLALLITTLLAVVMPFLTQAIVDVGVQDREINLIYLILLGQFFVIIGRIIVRYIQNYLLLYVGARIGITIVNDFLSLFMRLPMKFFDSKTSGDLLQRTNDNKRIENFLTFSIQGFIFSIFTLLAFSFVLFFYSAKVFAIFLIGSVLYILWILLFLSRVRKLDYLNFQKQAEAQNSIIEIIRGIHEIKLQGSFLKRKVKWFESQISLFTIRINLYKIRELQSSGGSLINQVTNSIILVVVALEVINGSMTLGEMLAIQFVVGSLYGPILRIAEFIKTGQEAELSYERLNEVTSMSGEDEKKIFKPFTADSLLKGGSIKLEQVSFSYSANAGNEVLKNIDLEFPLGQKTAIVGLSGSGKTTLVKLLLGLYQPTKGKIMINDTELALINNDDWLRSCGVVMQNGYLFADTIESNIAESTDQIDQEKLEAAVSMANVEEFVDRLPYGLQTVLNAEGGSISQGQKQRLLIARAIYKDPEIFFFDEATNSLDATNEREIVDKLEVHLKQKTTIVVAHRLSTVSNADKIVVIDKGEIVEQGSHQELVEARGVYFNLVRDQLELGK